MIIKVTIPKDAMDEPRTPKFCLLCRMETTDIDKFSMLFVGKGILYFFTGENYVHHPEDPVINSAFGSEIGFGICMECDKKWRALK